ncbi:Hypothetical predicted protein, partial [Pelobates cultripes]
SQGLVPGKVGTFTVQEFGGIQAAEEIHWGQRVGLGAGTRWQQQCCALQVSSYADSGVQEIVPEEEEAIHHKGISMRQHRTLLVRK